VWCMVCVCARVVCACGVHGMCVWCGVCVVCGVCGVCVWCVCEFERERKTDCGPTQFPVWTHLQLPKALSIGTTDL
jgi:hypothetical protein